jgi:ribonuclease R
MWTTGSAIDMDAYDRATSVYFPRRVIPMLPEKLSNGLCSLNPEVERLCMVCDMLVSSMQATDHAYQFYPAVMWSHARFTYTEVAAHFGQYTGARGPQTRGAGPCARIAATCMTFTVRCCKPVAGAGAVDFETTETQIVCDDSGRIEKIVPRTRNDAHRLIEEAMLAANVCTADFIAQSKHPGLYRVHEGPTPEKKEILRNLPASAMGVGLTHQRRAHPGEFQRIAEATKDRPDAKQIHTMLLRSMQQAIYTPINGGHFGLAFEAYTHFTSPIRRYPDLLVHRTIKADIGGKKSTSCLPCPRPGRRTPSWRAAWKTNGPRHPAASPRKPRLRPPRKYMAWQAAGLHCSANERRADEASRDVEAWLKCKYMREHLGEEFWGVVTAVTSFGIFVTLDAMYVEGLVHITELGGEYFRSTKRAKNCAASAVAFAMPLARECAFK